jgi:prevent-host-death family protein
MHEAKTQLSQLVARAEAGEEIVIARAGEPVARIVPVRPPRRARGFGSMPELAAAADAILEPLPEEELRRWEGG